MVNISLKREKKSHLISGEEDEGLVYIRFKQVKMAPIYTRVKKIKKKTKKKTDIGLVYTGSKKVDIYKFETRRQKC